MSDRFDIVRREMKRQVDEGIRPSIASTNSVGYTDNTGGSRTTYATGMASYRAAELMIGELKTRVAKIWDINPSEVVYDDGTFSAMQDAELQSMSMTFKELAGRIDGTGGPVSVTSSVDIPEAGGAFGSHLVDLEVDHIAARDMFGDIVR